MNDAQASSAAISPAAGTSRWQAWLWGAALVLLVLAVYWPTLRGGFIFDDSTYVQYNPALRTGAGLGTIWFTLGTYEQYYPLVLTTYWAEYHLWGLAPWGFHLVNLLIHAAAAVLVWRLLVRLAVPGAWLGAAIFAVHPLAVESIVPVNARNISLSCLLAVAALLAYLRFAPLDAPLAEKPRPRGLSGWSYYGLALALFVAALLAKTAVAVVPAVLLVIVWWKRGRVTGRDLVPLLPFFAIGSSLSALTMSLESAHIASVGEGPWAFSPAERVLIAGRAWWFYAGKFIWPYPLLVPYSRWLVDSETWWQYLFPLSVAAVIVAAWFAQKPAGRGPLAAVLIFSLLLLPVLGFQNIFFFRYSLVADHLGQQATIALAALVAAGVVWAVGRAPEATRRWAPAAGVALVMLLAVMTHLRTYAWHDSASVLEESVRLAPDDWRARHFFAIYLQESGRDQDALEQLQAAIKLQQELVKHPSSRVDDENDLASSYVDLGSVQARVGHATAAETSFAAAIKIRERLVKDYPSAYEFQEGLANAHARLALAESTTGLLGDAILEHHKAIEIRERLAERYPDEDHYRNDIAASYFAIASLGRALGEEVEPERAFRKAIAFQELLVRERPAMTQYQLDLANSYMALAEKTSGGSNDAAVLLRKAIEVRQRVAQANPTFEQYQIDASQSYLGLGIVLRNMGRPAEAEQAYRKAIEIRERLAEANPRSGPYRDELAALSVGYADLQRILGRPAEAERVYRKSIEIRQGIVRDEPTVAVYQAGLAWSYANLAVHLLAAGRAADAAATSEQTVAIRQRLASEHPEEGSYQSALGWSLANLGVAQLAADDAKAAEASHRKALELREALVEKRPGVDEYKHELALSHRDLADLYKAEGKLDEAVEAYQQAIAMHRKVSRAHPNDYACAVNLANDLLPCAEALIMAGKWNEGAGLYGEAVGMGEVSWPTMSVLALVQLAAGNDTDYRAIAGNLVERHSAEDNQDAVVLMALVLVAGEQTLLDMRPALSLAERAAAVDPSQPFGAVLSAAAQYRAGQGKPAVAKLAKAMAQLDAAATETDPTPQRTRAVRLVGSLLLADAAQRLAGPKAQQKQFEALKKVIAEVKPTGKDAPGPWPSAVIRALVGIAENELARLSAAADESTSSESSAGS